MKRQFLCCCLVAAIRLSLSAQSYTEPGPLPDKDVDTAILLGRAHKMDSMVAGCTAVITSGSAWAALGGLGAAVQANREQAAAHYAVVAMNRRGWIASAAWNANEDGKPFARTDVQADWQQPRIYVSAIQMLPPTDREAVIPTEITSITLRVYHVHQDNPTDIKPDGPLQFIPHVWKNVAGATVDYKQALATFDPGRIPMSLDDPVYFSIGTADGDRRCDISSHALGRVQMDKK